MGLGGQAGLGSSIVTGRITGSACYLYPIRDNTAEHPATYLGCISPGAVVWRPMTLPNTMSLASPTVGKSSLTITKNWGA